MARYYRISVCISEGCAVWRLLTNLTFASGIKSCLFAL